MLKKRTKIKSLNTFLGLKGLEDLLFEDDSQLLKLNKLDDFLSKEEKMPGINSPFIYVGEAGSAFAMHIEDKALFSINFLHTGATKLWIM